MIAEIITGVASIGLGMLAIMAPIYGWKEVDLFLTPDEVPTMRVMLVAVAVIGIGLIYSGSSMLYTLIG